MIRISVGLNFGIGYWHWIDIVLGGILEPELIFDRQIISMGISPLVLCLHQLAIIGGFLGKSTKV